ncbi:uncharacterized protein LOC124927249 [Impatiens glandulifera]|uniref:uncharacterized protein LOC124927249 n=1 Tax=Impatiens glandulifera TaxID=253017 RepID=UPI001FB0D6DC|nr:uncharacterized protein LOC124927249 [Impatiens glandulifera]
MDISQEVDNYVKESIDYVLGLPVSTDTLETKLRSSEEARKILQGQYLHMQFKLKEKDEAVERVRAESSMNALALKRFVGENHKLATECANLLNQCKKLERECSLYDHDREALMDFGNEADERAKEAELRVHELEEQLTRLSEELQNRHQPDLQSIVDSYVNSSEVEESPLDSIMSSIVGKDETGTTAHAFLEANSESEACQTLLKLWNSSGVSPSTQKVLALAAQVKALEKDKEHLRINLNKAEEEVNAIIEENTVLDKENKKLLKQIRKERSLAGSDEKRTSGKLQGSKRKSSPTAQMINSPIGRIDFCDVDSPRKTLSPLQYKNDSPEFRSYKK